MNPPMNPTAPQDAARGQALKIARFFTDGETHPFDAVEWEVRDARIGHGERVAFEQRGVEFPASWSQNATNIVAQKYFRGQLGSPEREHSVRQMIGRVAGTITRWGREGGYFDADARRARPSSTSSPTSCCTRWRPSTRRCGSTWASRSSRSARPACPATRSSRRPPGWSRSARSSRAKWSAPRSTTRAAPRACWPSSTTAAGRCGGWACATAASSRPPPTTSSRRAPSAGAAPAWLRVDQLQRRDAHAPAPPQGEGRRPRARDGGRPRGRVGARADRRDRPHGGRRGGAGRVAAGGWLRRRAPEHRGPARWRSNSRSPERRSSTGSAATSTWPSRTSPARSREASLESTQVRRISLHGEALRGYVERWGLLACGTEARVPERLYTASHEEITAYLRSVFQAGGYVSLRHSGGYESARVGVATISGRWSEDVQLLLGHARDLLAALPAGARSATAATSCSRSGSRSAPSGPASPSSSASSPTRSSASC